jgi:hypothetical protein
MEIPRENNRRDIARVIPANYSKNLHLLDNVPGRTRHFQGVANGIVKEINSYNDVIDSNLKEIQNADKDSVNYVDYVGVRESEISDAFTRLKSLDREAFQFRDDEVNEVHFRERNEERSRLKQNKERVSHTYSTNEFNSSFRKGGNTYKLGGGTRKSYSNDQPKLAKSIPKINSFKTNMQASLTEHGLKGYFDDIRKYNDQSRCHVLDWCDAPLNWYPEAMPGQCARNSMLASSICLNQWNESSTCDIKENKPRVLKKTLKYIPNAKCFSQITSLYESIKVRQSKRNHILFNKDALYIFLMETICLTILRISFGSCDFSTFLEPFKLFAKLKLIESFRLIDALLSGDSNICSLYIKCIAITESVSSDYIIRLHATKTSSTIYSSNEGEAFESAKLIFATSLAQLQFCSGDNFNLFTDDKIKFMDLTFTKYFNPLTPHTLPYTFKTVSIQDFDKISQLLCDLGDFPYSCKWQNSCDMLIGPTAKWHHGLAAYTRIEKPRKGKSRDVLATSLTCIFFCCGKVMDQNSKLIDKSKITHSVELYSTHSFQPTLCYIEAVEIYDVFHKQPVANRFAFKFILDRFYLGREQLKKSVELEQKQYDEFMLSIMRNTYVNLKAFRDLTNSCGYEPDDNYYSELIDMLYEEYEDNKIANGEQTLHSDELASLYELDSRLYYRYGKSTKMSKPDVEYVGKEDEIEWY